MATIQEKTRWTTARQTFVAFLLLSNVGLVSVYAVWQTFDKPG